MLKMMNALHIAILPYVAVTLIATSIPAAAAVISATGWNDDVVMGSGETYASHGNPISSNYIWFTTGLGITGTGGNGGLNPSGAVTVGGKDFQFQSFTGGTSNALVGNGTLTLGTPAKFTELSILGSDTGNGTQGTLTLNFADTSTAVITLNNSSFPNWASGVSAISPDPRLTNNGTTAVFTGAIGVLTLDLTNLNSTDYSGRTLNSISLSNVTVNSTTLFALNAVPEPSSSCLVLLGLSGLMLVRRRR